MRLSLEGVTKSYGAQPVLNDVTLAVGPRTRIGLVGPNGVGKSTLLRVLAGLEDPDAGAVVQAPGDLLVGYLAQERDLRADEPLLDYLARRTGVAGAERELDRLTRELAENPDAVDAYTDALDRFLGLGGADLDARARGVCAELGLAARLDRPVAGLSGGEAGRAALASILLARFDVFLLDEPTNDLDADGLERLEAHLAGLPGGVVVISHDRAFLDATVNRIAALEPRDHTLREWAGGWSDFAERREIERRGAYAAFEQSQERRREVTALLARRRTEARAHGPGAGRRGTHALMTKVRQAERALGRVDGPAKPFEPWELHLALRAGARPGDVVAALDRAVVVRGQFSLGPIDLDVAWRDRVVVTGPNGSGKSTLLAALLGELPLEAGTRVVGRHTVVGSIDQRRERYRGVEPLLEAFRARTRLSPEDARTLLAKFGLGAEHIGRPAGSLSPGERTRAQLAELQTQNVNLLVLDEPTNHLDLEAVEQLEQALAAYDGSLVVVSHDRRFLEGIAPDHEVALP
ncbi:MAG TPA: ABC-F family ATP-binding cassette domain-containing protein [Gaiellaceae bacterium]|nr:ABC-F family ATP-binding cassette domain-containing protein [Gaiellaceae bacterium]